MRVLCHHCDKPLEHSDAVWVDGFPYHTGSCDRYYVIGYRHLCVYCTSPIRDTVYLRPSDYKPCHKHCLDRHSDVPFPVAEANRATQAAIALNELSRRVSALEQRLAADARQA